MTNNHPRLDDGIYLNIMNHPNVPETNMRWQVYDENHPEIMEYAGSQKVALKKYFNRLWELVSLGLEYENELDVQEKDNYLN
jgi:hypothetical protein